MLGRTERLRIAQRVAGILRDTGALDRIRDHGYTRIDPFRIAAESDLAVMKRALNDLLGGFFRDARSGILINIDRPPGMVHMTCAHELGHYFLGHQTTVDLTLDYGSGGDTKEREADWFAYHLLMPRSLIVDVMRRKGWQPGDLRNPTVLYQLSLRLGTSFSATYWTLVSLELLKLGSAEGEMLLATKLQQLKRSLVPGSKSGTVSDVWLLDENDRDRVLEPRPQDEFILKLPNHAAAGYLWSVEELAAEGFKLHPLMDESIVGNGTIEEPIVVGGSPRQTYVLEREVPVHQRKQRLDLRFKEARPWRKDSQYSNAFSLATEFENLSLGLDEVSKERLLAEATQHDDHRHD